MIQNVVLHEGRLVATTYNDETGTEVWISNTGLDWVQVTQATSALILESTGSSASRGSSTRRRNQHSRASGDQRTVRIGCR